MLKTLKPSDIANYCNVHQRTVSRWIASGQLPGHKLPGRGNYRVLAEDFIAFLEQQNMPIPPMFSASKSVLLVDDDATIRRSFKRALSREGFEVFEAAGGVEAGLMLAQVVPDFVVLDLAMPGVDGFEVIQIIQQQPSLKHCKIIVLSGLADTELQRALELGAVCALAKPCELSVLVDEINRRAGNLSLQRLAP